MRRSDRSGIIALAASVLLHAATLVVCGRLATAPGVNAPAGTKPQAETSRILLDLPSPPRPPEVRHTPREEPPPLPPEPPKPIPVPRLTPPPPLPPAPAIAPELMPENMPVRKPADGLGELTGEENATALHSLDGDRPMQAKKDDQDQAFISRDPVGGQASSPKEQNVMVKPQAGDSRAALPDVRASDRVENARAQEPSLPEQARAEQREVLANVETPKRPTDLRFGPRAELQESRREKLTKAEAAVKAVERSEERMSPATKPISMPKEEIAAASEAPESAKQRGPSAGDAAPMTDSESDPFSTVGAAEFRPGKVVARFGRKVKTVRPRLTLAGQYDLISLASPTVVMRVRTDESGKVRDVQIVRSSGSQEVDQPCQLAMYEWWFEPPRDKNGRPQPAEMIWTFAFRGS